MTSGLNERDFCCRGIIPPLGGTLDLSPILAFVALDVSLTSRPCICNACLANKISCEMNNIYHRMRPTLMCSSSPTPLQLCRVNQKRASRRTRKIPCTYSRPPRLHSSCAICQEEGDRYARIYNSVSWLTKLSVCFLTELTYSVFKARSSRGHACL